MSSKLSFMIEIFGFLTVILSPDGSGQALTQDPHTKMRLRDSETSLPALCFGRQVQNDFSGVIYSIIVNKK